MGSFKNIIVSVGEQKLILYEHSLLVKKFSIATAKNGTGQLFGSECTPLGRHYIRAKVGDGCPENTVFIARRPTGEIYSHLLKAENPNRDWILTRIMWLCGMEKGKNRLGNVDTMRRYVYIHGCPDEDPMGIPSSHGCVKMRNSDVIELFDLIDLSTEVLIEE